MSTIIQLSDTHFGTEVQKVMHAVERSVNEIRPNIITITGDITQRARPSQFQAANAFLKRLPADIRFVIPGNHDIPLFHLPQRLISPYRNYTKAFGLREGIWYHQHIALIGYNATNRWRHTRGKLFDDDVIDYAIRARAHVGPRGIVIACAHQPLATAWPEDDDNVLIHAPQTAELFAACHVDMVLSGHVHVPIIETTHEKFPELSPHFILCGAGSAISHRIRPGAPNSFNVIRADDDGIHVILMEYDAMAERFNAQSAYHFVRVEQGWMPA